MNKFLYGLTLILSGCISSQKEPPNIPQTVRPEIKTFYENTKEFGYWKKNGDYRIAYSINYKDRRYDVSFTVSQKDTEFWCMFKEADDLWVLFEVNNDEIKATRKRWTGCSFKNEPVSPNNFNLESIAQQAVKDITGD